MATIAFPNYGGPYVHRQAAMGTRVNASQWTGAYFLTLPGEQTAEVWLNKSQAGIDATTPASYVRQWGDAVFGPAPAPVLPGTPGAEQPSTRGMDIRGLPGVGSVAGSALDAAKGAGTRVVLGVLAVIVIALAVWALIK